MLLCVEQEAPGWLEMMMMMAMPRATLIIFLVTDCVVRRSGVPWAVGRASYSYQYNRGYMEGRKITGCVSRCSFLPSPLTGTETHFFFHQESPTSSPKRSLYWTRPRNNMSDVFPGPNLRCCWAESTWRPGHTDFPQAHTPFR